jgi:hypothetical protein
MEAAGNFESSVNATRLHGATTQKAAVLNSRLVSYEMGGLTCDILQFIVWSI